MTRGTQSGKNRNGERWPASGARDYLREALSSTCNVLFRDETGHDSESQIVAFDDTWHWGDSAEETYHELVNDTAPNVSKMIGALREFIGANQMMAYLVMMAARLVELHRVLKPTGSLYLHCDPTASHYLKIVLDTIFGPQDFRNEIIWKRTSAHGDAARHLASIHDVILFYTRADNATLNRQYEPYDDEYVETHFVHQDPDGRKFRRVDLRSPSPRPNLTYEYKGYKPHPNGWAISREKMEQLDAEGRLFFPKKGETGRIRRKLYLDESPGAPISDLWTDIKPIFSVASERLGYPTQKPLALLERIIQTSSNPGDWVLDPFCGCGTAIAAAQKLERRWIGIDVTHLAISLQKYRMAAMFPGIAFRVIGEPEDIGAARQLAHDDRYQFQWWALSLVRAKPLGGQGDSKTGKKGSDKGVDGVITFLDDTTGKPKQAIVQVKSGHVKSGDIRDLKGTLEREKAALGVFITLESPSPDMDTEAVSAGFYESPGWNQKYRRIQILTIEALLHGVQVQMPPTAQTFKQAPKAEQTQPGQLPLDV